VEALLWRVLQDLEVPLICPFQTQIRSQILEVANNRESDAFNAHRHLFIKSGICG
jgi:hypothetical protein